MRFLQWCFHLRLHEVWLDEEHKARGTYSIREIPRNWLERLSVRLFGYKQIVGGN